MLLLGFALQLSDGFYDPRALTALGCAVVLVASGLLRLGSRLAGGPGRDSLVVGVLLAGIAGGLATLAVSNPGYYLAEPRAADHPLLLAGLAAAAVLTLLITFDSNVRARRLWFPALLMVFVVLGVWLIRASPDPQIDVVTVQRAAARALMRGRSPYHIVFRNIYDHSGFYGSGLVVDGKVLFGLPYPPLSLLMALPGHVLFDDVRYAELVALVAGVGAIGYAAAGRVAPLAAAALLFTPRTFFVLEQGWTEAFAICWLGFTVLAATRRWDRRWWPLGLLIAVKQHMALALALAGWLVEPPGDRRQALRLVVRALAVAAAVTIPFVLWDPAGFWHSVVSLQLHEPFRADSLSVLSALARGGWTVSGAAQTIAPLVALAVGLAATVRWAPRSPSGFAVGLGFAYLLLFAFSKKAFCNYYFFVIGALAAGIAGGGERQERAPDLPPADSVTAWLPPSGEIPDAPRPIGDSTVTSTGGLPHDGPPRLDSRTSVGRSRAVVEAGRPSGITPLLSRARLWLITSGQEVVCCPREQLEHP